MRHRRLAWVLLVVAVLCALPTPVRAWGAMGHEIVAELASSELSDAARAEVRRLLGQEGMASVASWADQIRKRRRDTAPWHFVNIPLDAELYDAARDCVGGRCIVAALERQLEILRDPRRARAARSDALKFVIHLVGDLHQPLHCVGDRGGNALQVRWFGRKENLHHVWDGDILTQAHLSTAQQKARFRALVREMPRRDALQLGDIEDWVNESHGLAVDVAYEVPSSHELGAPYYSASTQVVDLQLLRAGLRLGRLLNEALEPGAGAAQAPPAAPSAVPATPCTPREQCCKVCSAGQACGANCIPRSSTCHVGRGCACDGVDVCR